MPNPPAHTPGEVKFRLNQITLISQISADIQAQADAAADGKAKAVAVTPLQFNAIIQAANGIIAAFEREPVYAAPCMGRKAWMESDDTGMSSMAMCHHIFRTYCEDPDAHPHDADDFGRCHRFLEAVPEARPQLAKMAGVSPTWSRLVQSWDELTALYLAELPGNKQCPKLYARMKELGC